MKTTKMLGRAAGRIAGRAALLAGMAFMAAINPANAQEALRAGSTALHKYSRSDAPGDYVLAVRGGAATSTVVGGDVRSVGFGCQVGTWGIQDGVVKCVVSPADSVQSLLNKVMFVRATLVNGYVSGSVLRLSGTSTDIRLDALDNNGQIVKSCYLTVIGKDCDLGVPSSYFPTLANDPRYPYLTGAGGAALGTASQLVSTNARFMGQLVGGPLQDSFTITASLTQTGIRFHLAGVFYLSGLSGLMTPVYSLGEFTKTNLASAPTGTVFVLPQGWAAPF